MDPRTVKCGGPRGWRSAKSRPASTLRTPLGRASYFLPSRSVDLCEGGKEARIAGWSGGGTPTPGEEGRRGRRPEPAVGRGSRETLPLLSVSRDMERQLQSRYAVVA